RLSDGDLRRLFRNVGDLGDFALAEKDVNERLRLFREEALLKELGLATDAFIERQGGCGLHGVDRSLRRHHVALFLFRVGARSGEDGCVCFRRTELLVAVASAAWRQLTLRVEVP